MSSSVGSVSTSTSTSPIDITENSNNDNETISLNLKDMSDHFNELFSSGKSFNTLEALRSEVTEYNKKYNVVLSTKNSNYRSIHLWCKHAGEYRMGKKIRVDEDSGEEIHTVRLRQKRTQKIGCLCFIKARYIQGMWMIDKSFGEHNHPVPSNRNEYSINRKQSKETKMLIKHLLTNGYKVIDVLHHLSSIGITNIIKKDLQNMQHDLRRKKRRQAEASTIVALPIVIRTPTPEQVESIKTQTLEANVKIQTILHEQAKNLEETPASQNEQQIQKQKQKQKQIQKQKQERL